MVEEPRNPLFTRGVPLMPCTGLPPPYVAVKPLGADDDYIAHGKAYSDGACRGVFRRTGRAGWRFIVGQSHLCGQWSTYGTCLDAYASALRSELWAIVALLQRAIPPLCVPTDNCIHAKRASLARTYGEESGIWPGTWEGHSRAHCAKV